MSSMGSMDSMFDAFDNSSVGDLLDIKNSVAFLSRVFGKNIPISKLKRGMVAPELIFLKKSRKLRLLTQMIV